MFIKKLFSKRINLEQIKSLEFKPNHYERINFFKDFKNNGYTKRVLCLYEDLMLNSDVVYFNDRDMTEIPCIDKDVFIISNYNHKINVNTYTLVQVDFSIPIKYKILMSENTKDSSSNPKYLIYKYIRENKLVEIKNEPEIKNPQIDFGYGEIIIEVLEGLNKSTNKGYQYDKNKLFDSILDNVTLSKSFIESADSINDERTMCIRTKNRAMQYLDIIFNVCNKDLITIDEALEAGKKCQENYHYNI